MATKVLCIGLDGADRELIEQWTSSGRLPTIARLRHDGVHGRLAPLPGLGDDAAWSSFATGLTPGRHGRYYHSRIGPDGVSLVPHRRDDMTDPPFWDAIERSGRRVAVIDVPKSPMGESGAVVVADWMNHGADGPMTRLSDAARERGLEEHFIDDPTFDCTLRLTTAGQTEAFEQRLFARSRERTVALRALLDAEDWDLFTAVFAEPHCVGHQCWHDHDASHPEHDPDQFAVTGDVIEHVYQAVDACLAELIEAAGPDAIVIVFSLLGMGPNYSGTHLLDEALTRPKPATMRAWWVRALDRARLVIPERIRRSAPAPVVPWGRSVHQRADASKGYRVLPLDLAAGAIRFVQPDRDPYATNSRLAPDDVRQQLRDELMALEHPDTGGRLVREVVFTDIEYPASVDRALTDALVVWDQRAPIMGARSDRIGVIRRTAPRQRSGNHRGGGWFVATGPDISPAALDDVHAIVDLGPTIAALLGTRLTNVDGVPISSLCC